MEKTLDIIVLYYCPQLDCICHKDIYFIGRTVDLKSGLNYKNSLCQLYLTIGKSTAVLYCLLHPIGLGVFHVIGFIISV